jgi:hypothetical protein
LDTRVPITPEVLRWAVQRTGHTVEELSRQSDFKKLPLWIEGAGKPTLRQAEKLAEKAHVPFPFLLLDHPFEARIALPDFRTIGSTGVSHPSPELEQVIDDCQARLDWYKEYAEDAGLDHIELLEKYTTTDNPEEAAHTLRSVIGWEPGRYSYGDRAIAELTAIIEEQGVLVMRSSMVQNNTYRPLDLQEFRGFTLIQDGYALIFINTRDTKSGQIFSLAHELGHVVLGEPGVSGETMDGAPTIERWCNRFAAEFLIPAKYLQQEWDDSGSEVVKRLSHKLGVSPEAVVWRSVDLGLIPRNEAEAIIKESSYNGTEKPTRTGGNGINNMRPRLGTRFIRATANAMGSDLLQITDALHLLGLKNYNTARKLMDSVSEAA